MRVISLLVIIFSGVVLSGFTDAAQVDYVRINCERAIVQGQLDVPAPFVRITVTVASDLSAPIAETEVMPDEDSMYEATVTYPRQPDGTRLILSVGEWDGEAYLQPATLNSYVCGNVNPATVTPNMPYPSPTYPPLTPSLSPPTNVYMPTPAPTITFVPQPSPTYVRGVFPDQIVLADITLQYNTCSNFQSFTFSQDVTLYYSSSGALIGARREDRIYPIQTGFYPNQHSGRVEFREATYVLDVYFDDVGGFYANEEIRWDSGCIEYFTWMG